ncbi:hypothetical protein LX32DRAFT_246533 [Colletotrichum zoysiae]|uniref:Uncharacterized protein n=1 Tax=Colletotrichum zoysiae TaxID=1216348 RepID=A0AAD9M7U6_9PEZI|nr:hypothetical protein LX32DRAFT_246533 [Colletotrichum zoysiae]
MESIDLYIHVSQSRLARPCLELSSDVVGSLGTRLGAAVLCGLAKGHTRKNRRRACRAEPGVRMPLYPLCISNVCGILLEANRWLESPYPHTTHHSRPPLTGLSRWAPPPSSSSSGRSIAASLLGPLGHFPRRLQCTPSRQGRFVFLRLARPPYIARCNNCLNAGVGGLGVLSQR